MPELSGCCVAWGVISRAVASCAAQGQLGWAGSLTVWPMVMTVSQRFEGAMAGSPRLGRFTRICRPVLPLETARACTGAGRLRGSELVWRGRDVTPPRPRVSTCPGRGRSGSVGEWTFSRHREGCWLRKTPHGDTQRFTLELPVSPNDESG